MARSTHARISRDSVAALVREKPDDGVDERLAPAASLDFTNPKSPIPNP